MPEARPRLAARILQLCPNDHPPFRDVCEVYRAAGALLGCTVDTLVLSSPYGEPMAEATYLGARSLRSVGPIARRVRAHVEAGAAPVLAICHRYRAYRVLRRARARIPRVVAIAHEFGFFDRPQRRLEQRLFARGVRFAGVSPAVQADLARAVPEPLCLPNALDVDALEATLVPRAAALESLGVTPGPFTIGLLGRLVEKKRPALAIEALRAFTAEVPDARLLVIGDGELRARLAEQAAGLDVRFCGFVPDARRLLRALDVLLLVSKDIEAFGMVALEAMAATVPVVAGPSPGPRFVLGDIGFYYAEATPGSVAQALQRVHAARGGDALDIVLRRGAERARSEFSVPALAARLDGLLNDARCERSPQ